MCMYVCMYVCCIAVSVSDLLSAACYGRSLHDDDDDEVCQEDHCGLPPGCAAVPVFRADEEEHGARNSGLPGCCLDRQPLGSGRSAALAPVHERHAPNSLLRSRARRWSDIAP